MSEGISSVLAEAFETEDFDILKNVLSLNDLNKDTLSEEDKKLVEYILEIREFNAVKIHKKFGVGYSSRYLSLCDRHAEKEYEKSLEDHVIKILNDSDFQIFEKHFMQKINYQKLEEIEREREKKSFED